MDSDGLPPTTGLSERPPPRLLLRLAAALALVAALAWSLTPPPLIFTAVPLSLAVAVALAALYREWRRPWRALDNFLCGLAAGELSQRLAPSGGGAAARVATALNRIGATLTQRQHAALAEALVQRALLDHAPVALLCVNERDGALWSNRAARQLLGTAPAGREGLRPIGSALYAAATADAPVAATVDLTIDGASQRFALRVAEVTAAPGRYRLLALQALQSDLDAATSATARNLARVLTHELLNGLTPIASLAESVHTMLAPLDTPPDAQLALATLQRRALTLRDFALRAQDYARLPAPRRRTLEAAPFLADLLRLASAERLHPRVEFTLAVEAGLVLLADSELLQQALANLLRNAAQAAASHAAAPRVHLSAMRVRDSAIAIEIDDNGPGIDPAVRELMFLPFFTTRENGSGIGAAVARQVALAHGGSLSAQVSSWGGARLRLLLPTA
jgi:two-component system nitrogen regulation sensor histidine kinase NtrY